MRTLIELLLRNGGLIAFLILQAISLSLVVRHNEEQEVIYKYNAERVTQFVYNKYDDLARFWKLSEIADSLARENIYLRDQLDRTRTTLRVNRDTTLSVDSTQRFVLYAAEIISNSISLNNNYIRINKGQKNAILPGMGVLCKDGVAGIVTETTDHYAKVMSVLSRSFQLSATIRKSGYFGLMRWRGMNPKLMRLEDIPKHAPVKTGDTVVTSGYSTLFPGGIPLGVVKKHTIQPGDNFYTIEVELFADLANVRYVYVVQNLFREELEKLEVKQTEDVE